MVNANADALGIIFPNSYDEQVPDLVNERLMASIPFASRYRMVDFILSSMVNCGIGNVSIIVRKNYHSLMDHLGSGREWDLARKKGGLNIVPPYSEKKIHRHIGITNHRLAVAHEAIDSGLYETLQFPFSYISGEQELELVNKCKAANMGFIAMAQMLLQLIPSSRFRKASEALTRKPIICTTPSPWQDRRSARSL